MALVRRRRIIFFILIAAFIVSVFIGYKILDKNNETKQYQINRRNQIEKNWEKIHAIDNRINVNINESEDVKSDNVNDEMSTSLNYNVHIFYYPWYGSPEFDHGSYYHWNHEFLPHWNNAETQKWPTGRHIPPGDIGSNFYPKLGCYSSRDPTVIKQHMEWIRSTNVGTVVVAWYPPGKADRQGRPWEDLMPVLLDVAHSHQLKIAFHIEPYPNRTVESLKDDITYIIDTYGRHPAFYYYNYKHKTHPLFYIYDSYLIPNRDWRRLLRSGSDDSIRGTRFDAYFLGLVLKNEDKNTLLGNGFDGFYTYFAANDFTFGSTWLNWKQLTGYGRVSKMISSISVGPGYVDDRVRPWNTINSRPRDDGLYYRKAWDNALDSRSNIISITSFNEWHEGTQIEPSIPKKYNDYKYLDYTPYDPDYYLSLTKEFVFKFTKFDKSGI